MPSLFSWINRVDDAATTLGGSTALTGTSLANLKARQLALYYDTATDPYTLDVTFTAALSTRVVALFGNFSATTTVRVTLSATALGNTDLGDSGTVTVAAGTDVNGMHVYILPATVSARYIRVTVNWDTAGSRVGRLWIGPAWIPAVNPIVGLGKAWIDTTPVAVNDRSGAVFADAGGKRRPMFDVGFDALSDTDFVSMDEMDAVAGRSGQILFVGDDNAARIGRWSCFGRITNEDRILLNLPGATNQWARAFRIEGEG